ncbi:LAQU0S03e04676g1_1 [Lachancea quebecensis]|uniref:Dol-P-Man:Man(5)GlcNAc(2)-PP-Dol alpha-1,3-mannosyltransferase n=1 Tax=Lachancea quebecensis TaxID=1654605 RepID=A0A0P1KRM1_9SACH|nr:LAQU0S03e04676g1_1 [Lachancea quebecensis]
MSSSGQVASSDPSKDLDVPGGSKQGSGEPEINILKDLKDAINYLIFNPEANHIIMPVVVVIELLALKWIVTHVEYTEIDYKAYMEQIWTIQAGETDYSAIEGSTGPLVYPAGHVWIYEALEHATSGMDNLKAGQTIFQCLYVATLALQMICYVLVQLPPWCVVLASLSKRLHSIYVLRLFNDCFTTFFVVSTVLLLLLSARLRRRSLCLLASFTYAMAVSVKMNALLYLPGFLLSIFQLTGGHFAQTVACLVVVCGWQIFVAMPFLQEHTAEYWAAAFDFKRQFMYRWSVNWQFVDEEVFQDKWFHRTLLASHIVILVLFAITRFFQRPIEIQRSLRALRHPFTSVLGLENRPSPTHIAYTLLMSNFVGVIFARSLHYQFLSWYHWTLPVIIHWSGLPLALAVPWYLLHEYCWNSYPPNPTSSMLLFALNTILLILAFWAAQVRVPRSKKEQ